MKKMKTYIFCMILCSIIWNQCFALENWTSGPILEKLQSYTEVKKAFERRALREKEIDSFLKQGVAGESNMGFVQAMYMNIPENERALLEDENRDRIIIMAGIAKALLEITGQPVNDANLKQKMPSAIRLFCDLREQYVPKGTWIQNSEGKWIQKF